MPWWINEASSRKFCNLQFHWPWGLRRMSAAARLLRLWVRIPPDSKMSVCCECCVFSGRSLYDELITRPKWILSTVVRHCVWSWNLVDEHALAHWGLSRQENKKSVITGYSWYTIQTIHSVDPVSFNVVWRYESINYGFMSSSSVFTLEHHLLVQIRIDCFLFFWSNTVNSIMR
jgi:hypothetical protein